jgi:hypothetical protein
MLDQSAAPPVALAEGMVVTHPEYGLGRIVELEGSGRRQMARVQFFDQESPITLSVVHSPLQPAS